jgi:ABC-type transport system substrate-binding protein
MENIEGLKKLLTLTGWKHFFKILTKREKRGFLILLILFSASFMIFGVNFYIRNTEIRPALGGTFIEGIVGQPRFINPIYASSNDIDRDLVELLFSGLMKYGQEGQIVNDLSESVEIEENGKIYRIRLKDNVFWTNNDSSSKARKLTADDVVFTIKTIQNPDYKSPLRVNWLGVEVEKISDYDVLFKLKNPYSAFLENLTVKIIPQYIWQNVSPEQFPLSVYNLNPVGSGPYKFVGLTQDNSGYIKSLSLKINPKTDREKPYLKDIRFRFFEKESDLINAAKKGEIGGFSLSAVESENLFNNSSFREYDFPMPRYFAVFFNPSKSKILSDKKVRQALNYGVDKEEVVKNILNSRALIVDSPILPNIYGFEAPETIYQFDLDAAKVLLDEAGYKENENGIREKIVNKDPAFQFKSNLQTGSSGTEVEELQKCLAKFPDIYPSGEISGYFGPKTKEAVIKFQEKYSEDILKPSGLTAGNGNVKQGTREKLNELCVKYPQERTPLKITLITVNQPTLVAVADLLKSQWRTLGVDVEIKALDDVSALERDVIKPRNYEAILFGEALGQIPDPFPFWDSIQKNDPGLNLAVYENKNADKLLEEARQTLDDGERQKKLEKFQDILIGDVPAVFLYSPSYIYSVSGEIKGLEETIITDPSKRFSEIENWYIKTKRSWK